ncbi:2-hydroxyglutaryl-CoA dehydratase [Dissulfurirhabdus thermomarina]|uniref:2-hydroxyglutaryl-CoA dehydratase n=1 Tax=Dissulfurirhabdus thermomarina TaxID=1765737 RepID=A0A6N9TJG5_DISTH|nr:acyl-CoA dehydratase activase [Dissulfurirhabdus thermomarina]NDY41395.1 2-hydroxyglutaryl-CoA dehydratase [Dissulfurirhabdus thermomarina]NMX23589.1 2-hydroxyglutaryl-CoA dehydratase [Dissulfurirhabdus thermomarina]
MAPHTPEIHLGIDVGSVTTKVVALEAGTGALLAGYYLRTHGNPLAALREAMGRLAADLGRPRVLAAATTGSGRALAARLVNTDIAKNEITTHTLAAVRINPAVRTVVEIGGQDSKIILVREGLAVDFAMNTVCAAGTGSFLDQQAGRLGLRVEEMGALALASENPAPISGRCTVFAETDMIHKQQIGLPVADIVAGLCRSLVRNYLASVARGKALEAPVVFQGGVAANAGIVREFERQTGLSFEVSPHHGVAGAYGAALLAAAADGERPPFLGYELLEREFRVDSFVCRRCEEACSVLRLHRDGRPVSFWNDRCGRWSGAVEGPRG